MSHPDQKYINALLTNDMVVLDELYKKFSGKIKQMVIKNHGSDTDAADIFQEALIAIYIKALNGDFILTCPFEAFLYIIARNKWRKELLKRKNGRVTIVGDKDYIIHEDCFALAEECLLHEERTKLLIQKLAELGEGCKKMLQLSWSGIPMDQVATMMNLTYGYARKRKSTCMAELISLMKNADQYHLLKK